MFEMLTNILRNLGSKPATRKYPYEKREPFKDTRGKVGIDVSKCIFCGICARKCPSDAITVNKNEKSWEIDPFKCIICGECAQVCPKKCVNMEPCHGQSAYCKQKSKHIQQVEASTDAAVNAGAANAATKVQNPQV